MLISSPLVLFIQKSLDKPSLISYIGVIHNGDPNPMQNPAESAITTAQALIENPTTLDLDQLTHQLELAALEGAEIGRAHV